MDNYLRIDGKHRRLWDKQSVNVFTFDCSDLGQLKSVMRALQKVEGVVGVDRV